MHKRFAQIGASNAKFLWRIFRRRSRGNCNYPSGSYRYEQQKPQPSPEKKEHEARVNKLAERMTKNFDVIKERRQVALEAGKAVIEKSWKDVDVYFRYYWKKIREQHNRIRGRNFKARNKLLSELDALLDKFDAKIDEFDTFYEEAYGTINAQQTEVEKTDPFDNMYVHPEEEKPIVSMPSVTRKGVEEIPEVHDKTVRNINRQNTVRELQGDAVRSDVRNYVNIETLERREREQETVEKQEEREQIEKPLVRRFNVTVGEPFFIDLADNHQITPKVDVVLFDADPFDDIDPVEQRNLMVPDKDTVTWNLQTTERKQDGKVFQFNHLLHFTFAKPGTATFSVVDENDPDAPVQEYVITATTKQEQERREQRSLQYIEEVSRKQQEQASLQKQIQGVEDTIKREGTADVFQDEEPLPFDEIVDSAISMLEEDPGSFLAITTLNQQLHATGIEANKAKQQQILEKGKHIQSADGRVWQLQLDSEGKFTLEEIGE